MAAVYTVTMANQTIVADATLVILRAASAITSRGSILELLRATVSQQGTSTSEQLGVILGRKVTAFGTYSSATPSPAVVGGVASGITGGTAGAAGTAGVDATAEGGGAVTALISDGFNNLNGFLWVPTPEERVILAVGEAFVVKLRGTPTTLTGWNASLTFREIA
jgi:hypothetical protein